MRDIKKAIIVAIVSVVISLGILAYGTYAFFTDTTISQGNKVVASTGVKNVTVKDYVYNEEGEIVPSPSVIKVLPGKEIAKSVTLENKNLTPVYVRAKYYLDLTLSSENASREDEIDLSLVVVEINQTKWIYNDGYYYYDGAILAGAETELFITSVSFDKDMPNLYQDSLISIKTRFEIVQANNNGATVFDAVGWITPDQEGGSV